MAVTLPSPFVRPEATTWSVEEILHRAREGQLFIPKFQRSFRWKADDVRKLLDSIYRGYPIGDLLVWETENTKGATTAFGPVKFQPADGRAFIVIDGQQRITSLVASLLGDKHKDATFRVYFDLKDGSFLHARGSEAAKDSWLPLPEVSDTVRFLQWLQERKLPKGYVDTANHLVRALRDYRVPVYVVHTGDEGRIREIFERLNTTGKRLNAPEIFSALQRGRQTTDLRTLADRVLELNFGVLEEQWLLKAVAAVLQVDVTKNLGESLRKMKPDAVDRGLRDTDRAIRNAVVFLREDVGVPHIELLPYRFPLVPLTKLFSLVPNPSEQVRAKLAAWVWRGVWSGQHARSDAPTIRGTLQHITDDERATADKLLAEMPVPKEPFRLRRHDFRSAATKLTCAVLASLEPRDMATGTTIDLATLLQEYGSEAVQQVVASGTGDEYVGTQNRILHPPLPGAARDTVLAAAPKALASHCIDPSAVEFLRNGDDESFLAHRKALLERRVNAFLKQRVHMESTG